MTARKVSIKTDNRPLYDRAIDAVIHFIEVRGYKSGDRLPGEAELARNLGISRPTLREAMSSLERQGILTRRHGVGSFVASPVFGLIHGGLERLESMYSLMRNAGVEAERGDWVITSCLATEETARKLQIQLDDPIVQVQITIKEKDRYFVYLNGYTLAAYIDLLELEVFNDGSLLDYLLEKREVRLSYTYSNIYAVTATAAEASWLHVEINRPLLFLEETFFSDTGTPIVWTRNYFITDNVNFHIIRRIIPRN